MEIQKRHFLFNKPYFLGKQESGLLLNCSTGRNLAGRRVIDQGKNNSPYGTNGEDRNHRRERGARPLCIQEQRWTQSPGTERSQPGVWSSPPVLERWVGPAETAPSPPGCVTSDPLWVSWSLHLSNEGTGPSLCFSSLKAFFFFFSSYNCVGQMNLTEQLITLK